MNTNAMAMASGERSAELCAVEMMREKNTVGS